MDGTDRLGGLIGSRGRLDASRARMALVDELMASARRSLVDAGELDGPEVLGDVVDVALSEPAFAEDLVGFVGSVGGEFLEGGT